MLGSLGGIYEFDGVQHIFHMAPDIAQVLGIERPSLRFLRANSFMRLIISLVIINVLSLAKLDKTRMMAV